MYEELRNSRDFSLLEGVIVMTILNGTKKNNAPNLKDNFLMIVQLYLKLF